jgi:hypothetical protein
MAWTTPHTFTVSEVVSAATLNAGSNDLAFLYGDGAWTAPALTATWTNTGGGFSIVAYRIAGNTVYLRGRCSGGGVGTQIFILPVGYRPINGQVAMGGAGNSAFASVGVSTAGVVAHAAGAVDVNLSCVIFDILN